MDDEQRQRPLLEGRSWLRFEDFCLNTGLDPDSAQWFVENERLEQSLWSGDEPRRLVGIFLEALPTRESLVDLGLPVSDDYDPEHLRYGLIE